MEGIVATLSYFLVACLSSLVYILSGYAAVSIASLLARRVGARVRPSTMHKLASGLVASVSLICVSSFPLRVGLGSVDAYLQALGPILALLAIVGGALLVYDLRSSGASLHLTREGVVYVAALASIFAVISYLYVTQSVDTNYDFYYANYKAIGWALHDGNMANPLLQPLYDQRGFPAYWSYVALDGVLGQGASLFSVSIASLVTLCLAVYAFAREHMGREAGMAASLLVLASPLTFLYSYRGLDTDLLTYSAVFLAFVATLKALRRDEGSPGWALLAGISSGVALMSDPKGFMVLLLVPTAVVAASGWRAAKAFWSVAVYGILAYVVTAPMRSSGLSSPAFVPLLSVLAVPVLLLYISMSAWGGGNGRGGGANIRRLLAFGLGVFPALLWTSLFGYLQTVSRTIPDTPVPVGTSLAIQYVINAPNMLYSFLGLFSYPSFGVPVALLGVGTAIHLLARKKETWLAQLFTFGIALMLLVLVFAQGSIGVDNWRYFYLMVPVGAIFVAVGLARLVGKGRLVPLSAVIAAALVVTLLPGTLAFNGSSLWFSNAVRGMEAWLDPAAVPWLTSAILLGAAYLTLSSVQRHAVHLREGISAFSKRWRPASGIVAFILAVVIVISVFAPFAPMIQRTTLADISQVRDTGPSWNAGLRAPFDYISQNRESFNGSAFLTYAAYGIEYYAGVPSLDMNQSDQVAPLLRYMGDPSALRAFLLDHGINYALFPQQNNNESGIGPSAYSLMSRTALGGLIWGSMVLMTWDGWTLYGLAQSSP